MKIFDVVAVLATFVAVVMVAAMTAFAVLGHDDRAFSYALFFGVPIATVVSVVVWREMKVIDRRRHLQERVCDKCGYDLRGQLEPRCPECGEPFGPSGH